MKDNNGSRNVIVDGSKLRVKQEGASVLRLDDVRPARQREIAKPAGAPSVLPRKTTVTYKASRVTDFVSKTTKSGISGNMLSFLLFVVLPTVMGGLYFVFFASPQYISEFRFSVRPTNGAGMSSSAMADTALTMSNSYIVSDYMGSRDAVEALDKAVGLRDIYSKDSIDMLSRLPKDVSLERLMSYWQSRVDTSYDLMTGINVVAVSAFTPDDALRIANGLQGLAENLVNSISEKARETQMAFSKAELDRAEVRLKDVRQKETDLRAGQKTIDVRKEAEGKIQLSNKLHSDLSGLKSQYLALTSYMDAKSPRLTVLRNQIDATQQQIDDMQAQISREGTGASAGMLDDAQRITQYDQLQTDLDIATKLYQSALSTYENARMQASNSQTYLATYVQPGLAQVASYPRVFLDTILVFLSALGIWVIGTLVFYSIRDHA